MQEQELAILYYKNLKIKNEIKETVWIQKKKAKPMAYEQMFPKVIICPDQYHYKM